MGENNGNWAVKCHNELNAEIGFNRRPSVIMTNLTKDAAERIARDMNKSCPAFLFYFIEEIDKNILDKDMLSVV